MSKSNNTLGKKFRRSLNRLKSSTRKKRDKAQGQTDSQSVEKEKGNFRVTDKRVGSLAARTDNINRFSIMSDPTNGFTNSDAFADDDDDSAASVHSSSLQGNGHLSDTQLRRPSAAESDVNGYFGLDSSSMRQSLGDSMTGSSSLTSRNSASSIYRSASHAFVNRQFIDALDGVESLLRPATFAELAEPARVRVWNLYFAIVDTAFTQSQVATGNPVPTYPAQWTPEIRESLISRMKKGQTITSVSVTYGALKNIDIQVMVPLIVLSLRVSMTPAALLQDKIEAYLAYASQDFYDQSYRDSYVKLIELYVLHVLPRQEEYNLGIAFVEGNETLTDEEKMRLVREIKETEAKIDRERQLEQDARRKHEQQEKEARQLRQHQEEERMLRKQAATTAAPLSVPPPRGGRLTSSMSANSLASGSSIPPQQVSTRSHIASVLRWSYGNMWDRFRQSIFKYGDSNGGTVQRVLLQSLLGFVVFLIFWLSPSRARRRLRDGLGVVWGRVVDTISMGMKVTSL